MTTSTETTVSALLERAQDAIAFERERADNAEAKLAVFADGLAATIAAAVAVERNRAEAAEAQLAAYENAITWDTSCLGCATILDSAIKETFRRETAEEKLAEAREILGNFLGQYGHSEIPLFKVAIDLANSLARIVGPDAGAEVSGG